ncbi:uncharacterized protein LOC107615368 [Arachis ipaensis]|uniref:At2g35280-like TPR domain-containing protein n=3 Tax=Arachis hypogaea TaxID=3818 RepID=A0A444XJP1_ARAHY|nr:uncharacterized protein LOC107615368 [Arachis ipaensis]RYQ89888.1 hypothetical protein Ahy_B09g096289 isoform C [Arachis hypogaea]
MYHPTGPANLPHDVWTLIAGRTAAQSVRDLCSLRMSCTAARNAGEEDIVYQFASIPIWDQRWWSMSPMRQAGRNFLARCMQSGNLEVLFRSAVSDLFLGGSRLAGMETMQVGAAQDHSAAQYTVSMMLMLRDDFESKNKGLQTFHVLEAAGALTICKLVFHDVIQGTWTHMRRLPMVNAENLVCSSHACPSRGNMGAIYRSQRYGRGWDLNDGDGGAAHIPCVHCRADYELILFVHLFD